MQHAILAVIMVVALLVLAAVPARAADAPLRLLFFTKSQGFEHSVIAEKDGKPSWAGTVLGKLADEHGYKLTCTKDAALVNAEYLKNFDIVISYTQGDLFQAGGTDGASAMAATGLDDLLAWIKDGGRFMGFHSASDTFHTPEGAPVTPYLQTVGGEFIGHGAQFEGTIVVVDPKHPTMAHIPEKWNVRDEWYCFKNINTASVHVLALLDPGQERGKQEMYNIPSYPMIWCSEYGKGRVYFNGMGHREDLWLNKIFKESIIDAFNWLMSDAPAQAEPNCEQVIPKEIAK